MQVCWGKLELNSAGHRPSRIKFDDPWIKQTISHEVRSDACADNTIRHKSQSCKRVFCEPCSLLLSVDGKLNYSWVQKDQGVTFNIMQRVNSHRPSLDDSGPEVWIITKRFGVVGQGYLKSSLLTQSGFSIHCCLLHLHCKWTMQCNVCFYFINTANVLYLHQKQAQNGLVKNGLLLKNLIFMQVCKIFAYVVQLINALNCVHCLLLLTMVIQSDLHCI